MAVSDYRAGQGRRDGADRRRRGRRRVRSGDAAMRSRRTPTGRSRSSTRTARTLSRCADAQDDAGLAQHGARRISHTLFLAGATFEAPAAGATARQRPKMVPGSFVVLVVQRQP